MTSVRSVDLGREPGPGRDPALDAALDAGLDPALGLDLAAPAPIPWTGPVPQAAGMAGDSTVPDRPMGIMSVLQRVWEGVAALTGGHGLSRWNRPAEFAPRR
ncbi:hypothetical protein [Arthrobacter sp. A5]|uniref:hypothetical protein n=1 Tax=Arthrobacter sp. A5 TaxID=576926 RepID=UPI003DAA06C6